MSYNLDWDIGWGVADFSNDSNTIVVKGHSQ